MRRLLSDRVERPAVAGRGRLLAAALIALGLAAPVRAQQGTDTIETTASTTVAPADSIIAAAVNVSGSQAALELGLSDGRSVQLELAGGVVRADGDALGRYEENDALDRSWRELLEQAAMVSTAELPGILRAWEPPIGSAAARQLDERLEAALAGVGGTIVTTTTRLGAASAEDSIEELLARIEDLEDDVDHDWDDREYSSGEAFLHDMAEGFAGLVAALVWLGVMIGLGAALLFFGRGRLERVALTIRDEPVRSGLIGMAGLFLAFPFWILVTLALAISILGIPLILAWMPLFPMLVVLSVIAGWLAAAYGTGDAMVAGRLQDQPRFQNASPVKRLAVGVALLLSPFFLAALFQMTSVLDWVGALFFVIGLVTNFLVACVGLGAVMSHGRDALDRQRERRAARRRARAEQQQTIATEGTNV